MPPGDYDVLHVTGIHPCRILMPASVKSVAIFTCWWISIKLRKKDREDVRRTWLCSPCLFYLSRVDLILSEESGKLGMFISACFWVSRIIVQVKMKVCTIWMGQRRKLKNEDLDTQIWIWKEAFGFFSVIYSCSGLLWAASERHRKDLWWWEVLNSVWPSNPPKKPVLGGNQWRFLH